MKLKLVKKSDNAIHKYYALFEDGSVFSLYKQKDIKDVVNSIFEEEDVESISYPQGKRVFRRPILEKNEKVEVKKTKKPESFPSSLVYIISPTKVLTVYCDNQALSVHPTHVNYHQILEKVRNNDSNGLVELYNVKKAIENDIDEAKELQELINKAVAKGDTETAQSLLAILERQKNKNGKE
jgi:hypothetical protein